MKKIILILLMSMMMIGCGRVTDTGTQPTNDNGGNDGREGNLIVGQEILVNSSLIGDQKNPNITRLNNGLILAVFIDETMFKIKAVWYNSNMTRLQERTLYMQHAILDGRPGITAFNDGFLVSWESLDGVYVANYNNNGDCVVNDTKILETGSDDTMIQAINSKDILVLYERNQTGNGNKDIYRKIINI